MVHYLVEQIHEALAAAHEGDRVLALFNDLEATASLEDVPVLLVALQHDDADFFTREMFGQILCGFDQPELLEPLLVAFDRNLDEGHDNDGFQEALWGLVEATPERSAELLHQLREREPSTVKADTIRWLLKFCSDEPEENTGDRPSPMHRILRRLRR